MNEEEPAPKSHFKHSDPVTSTELASLAADRLDLETAASKLHKKRGPKFTRPESRSDNSWQKYAGLGIQLGVAITLFTLGGQWLDGEWGTEPTFTAIGALIGTFGGMYAVIRTVTKGEKKKKSKKQQDSQEG